MSWQSFFKYVRRNELSDDFHTAIVGNIRSQVVQIHNKYMNYNLCCQIVILFQILIVWILLVCHCYDPKLFILLGTCIIIRIFACRKNCFEWRKAFNIVWYWNNLYTSKKLAYMVVLSFWFYKIQNKYSK